MKKLREQLRDNPIFLRLILGSLGMTAITVFLLTFFFSHAAERFMQDEIFRSRQENLQRVANVVDFRAEYANYLMQTASRDKIISQLFYSTEGKDTLAAMKALSEMRQSVKQLQSVYVYNQYEDRIFLSNSTNAYAVQEKKQFEDKSFVDLLDHIQDYPKFTPFLRRAVEEKPNGQNYEEYVYTYLLYDSYSGGAIKNIIAFNFHLGWMGDAFSFISSGGFDQDQIQIIGKNRHIVYATDSSLIGSASDREMFPETIFEKASGYVLSGMGKNRTMLVYATPSHAGYEQWVFVSISNYADLVKPIVNLRNVFYLIAFLVTLASLGGTYFFSRTIYQPVKQVIDTAETLKLDRKRKLELERGMYLRRLMQGNVAEEPSKIKEQLSQLGMTYDMDQENRLLLLSVDYMHDYLPTHRNDTEKIAQHIEQTAEKVFSENYREHLLLKMREGLWCVCVPGEQGVRTVRLQRVFEQINKQIMEEDQASISIAVTSLGHSVGDIPYLYAEALNNLSFRFLLGQNRIFTPEETAEYGKEKFIYPHDLEEKMVSALFVGRKQDAETYYEQFMDQIRFCTVEDIRIALVLLANAIKRASRNTITEVSSVLTDFDQFHHKLQGLETLEEANQMFLHLIWEIGEKTQDYSQKKYEQLIQQVKDYVANNYGSMALSLNDVADHVDMSAAYLGRIFKQLTGIGFTDYLMKYRLDAACDLLLHSGKTVNEISDAVGFTNSSYFYIVFKKNLGCTPSQYRKQNELIPDTEDNV